MDSVIKSGDRSGKIQAYKLEVFGDHLLSNVIRGNKSSDGRKPGVSEQKPLTDPALDEAKKKAAQLISAAQQRSRELVQAAENEAESIRTASRQKGYEEGKAAAEMEYQAMLTALAKLSSDLAEQRRCLDQARTEDILRFALAVASKVIKGEVATNPDAIIGNINDALIRCQGAGELVLKVNPTDIDFVIKCLPDIRTATGQDDLEIVEDSGVDVGGCVVETSNGLLDARVWVQLREIARELLSDFNNAALTEEIAGEA